MLLEEVIDQRLVQPLPVGGDVTEEAVQRGWLLPFTEGQFVYGPEWTALLRRLQGLLLANAAALGFREHLFPRLLPAEAIDKFRLSEFKPGLLWRAEGGRILDPVQCLPLYFALRGQRLRASQLPLRVVETLGGWTWRREDPAELEGAYRTMEFARVEHVWIATPEMAADIRNTVRDSIAELLSNLGLSVRTIVGEPCMPIEEIDQRRAAATRGDDVPVIDIELLVRQGSAAADQPEFDEIGGCTVEGDHHLRSFDIGRDDDGALWSGCCGIGLNRLLIAFLFQHGFDAARWPAEVADHLSSSGSESYLAWTGQPA